MIRKVVLVFKTHFDFGFTDLAENVITQYAGPMLRDILTVCEETADMGSLRLVWTMSAMPLHEMLSRNTGETLRRLETLVREGRIVWHALPFTSHFDFCGMEEFIEGMRYSTGLASRFDRKSPVSAKMTDVPGYGRMLPSLLAGGGVHFLHLGSNEFPVTPQVPHLFFWEAPDGSRVLTMYSPGGYGSPLTPPEDWNLPVWIAFLHTHDNAGPQSPEGIRQIVREVQRAHPGAEIISGTMDDFYHAIADCDLSGIPVVDSDLADSWIHGVGAYPAEVSSVRGSRRKSLCIGAASILLNQQTKEVANLREEALRNLALFGEHTWGLDIKTWLPSQMRVYEKEAFLAALNTPPYLYMEESWKEQSGRASRAAELLSSAESLLDGKQAQHTGCVLNPNGESFTGWAEMPENDGALSLFGSSYSYVKNVPALSISPLPGKAEHTSQPPAISMLRNDTVVENHRYRIVFCGNSGFVREVFDKYLNVQLLKSQEDTGVFSYRYDIYGSGSLARYLSDYCKNPSDWGYKDNGRENYPDCAGGAFAPEFTGWELDGHTLILRYRGTQSQSFGDCEAVEIHITLPPEGDEFFAEIRLQAKQVTPYIESGSFIFPFAAGNPRYLLNKNGGLVDPTIDITTGANHALYCLEAFAAMEEGNVGVCIVAHDTPLLAIGETGIHTFRKEYERHEPQLFFNLFNNMWGTNFPQWIGGSFRYRFTLFGYMPKTPVYGRALGLYQGAQGVKYHAAACPFKLPEQVQVMEFSGDGRAGLLRLRDTSGLARQVEITAQDKYYSLWQADLLGTATGKEVKQRLSAQLAQYGVLTVCFRLEA